MAQMKDLANQIIAASKDSDCKAASQACRQKLRSLVEPHWEMYEMARMALGVHWKSLDDSERQRFARLFADLIEGIYLSRASLSNAEGVAKDVKIDFVREIPDGDDYSQVNTLVTMHGHEKPICVDYRLKRDGGTWKAYDVLVDKISVVSNYRNQFSRVINNKGYPELVRELQEKVQQVNSQGT
jgi:phospholipid transport system substrate-binding protein